MLESDRLAHLVTISPNGSPQVSCVWVGIEDEEIRRADGYRSSTATHSMWGVCGNRSTGRTQRSA